MVHTVHPGSQHLETRASLQSKQRFWCFSITNLLVRWGCCGCTYTFHNLLCLLIK